MNKTVHFVSGLPARRRKPFLQHPCPESAVPEYPHQRIIDIVLMVRNRWNRVIDSRPARRAGELRV